MARVKAVPMIAAFRHGKVPISVRNKDLNPTQQKDLKKKVLQHLESKGWEQTGRDKFTKVTGTHVHHIRMKSGTVKKHGKAITGLHFHHTYSKQNTGAKPVEYHKGGVDGIKTIQGFTGWRASVDRDAKSMHTSAIKKIDADFKKEGAKLDKARATARKKNPNVMFPKIKS